MLTVLNPLHPDGLDGVGGFIWSFSLERGLVKYSERCSHQLFEFDLQRVLTVALRLVGGENLIETCQMDDLWCSTDDEFYIHLVAALQLTEASVNTTDVHLHLHFTTSDRCSLLTGVTLVESVEGGFREKEYLSWCSLPSLPVQLGNEILRKFFLSSDNSLIILINFADAAAFVEFNTNNTFINKKNIEFET